MHVGIKLENNVYTLTFWKTWGVIFVREVDDHKADAGAGHGHEEKYQTFFQGAQTLGATTTLLHVHFPRSGGDAPDCASSNNSAAYHQHEEDQGTSELWLHRWTLSSLRWCHGFVWAINHTVS